MILDLAGKFCAWMAARKLKRAAFWIRAKEWCEGESE